MNNWWAIILGVFIGLLGGGILFLASSQPRGEPITLINPPTQAPIMIYISGAVNKPGVYSIPPKARIQDAIDAAGGLKQDADTASFNMAAFLTDGEHIEIPIIQATTAVPFRSGNPFVQPTNINTNPLININTASQAELESLPNIGPKTAQKIIAFRETNGPFDNISEIQDVPGIGPKTFESIKDLISVGELP